MDKYTLSNSHKRTLSSSFSIVEELLEEIREILENKKAKNLIFRRIKNALTLKKIDEVKNIINEMKKELEIIKSDLNLITEKFLSTSLISSRSAKMWEILCDLETRKLKKYGEVPSNLPEYLDPRIKKLIALAEKITETTKGK